MAHLITDIKLTSPFVHDIGKAAALALPPGRRHRFYYDAEYHLDNGTTRVTRVRALTKPKLEANLANTRRHIEHGLMTYDDDIGALLTLAARLSGGVSH